MQVVHELLRASHRKGGDEQPSAPLRCFGDDARKVLPRGIDTLVIAVAVGGLHDHDVRRVRGRRRIPDDRQSSAADVAEKTRHVTFVPSVTSSTTEAEPRMWPASV